tara:strand:- start:5697 stop:6164 length:468 start_codon:yes stop_codon:yes gene_type:complete
MIDNLLNKKAPRFLLKDSNNKDTSLESFKEGWLVIFFYPKDNTPGCTKEACLLRDDYSVIQSLNAQIIGINTDSVESHRKFQEKYKLPFALLSDEDGFISKKYHALYNIFFVKFSKRRSFIIDPQGVIKKIYKSVNPAIHSTEIISDLQLMQRKR